MTVGKPVGLLPRSVWTFMFATQNQAVPGCLFSVSLFSFMLRNFSSSVATL